MAIEVISRKFFNQFTNGVNLDLSQTLFTHYSLTWVAGKFKRITEIEIFIKSEADGEDWVLGTNTVTRLTGSFIDDGFVIGDAIFIEYTPGFGSQATTITNITDLIITTQNTLTATGIDAGMKIFLTTKQLGINYFSNTIENNDPATYVSRVDGVSDRKFTVEMTEAEYNANTEVTGTAIGTVLSWKQDTFSAKNTAAAAVGNDFRQRFELIEKFTVTPIFETVAKLKAGTPPPEFASGNSLRHIFRVETVPTILNPIIVHQLEDTDAPQTFGTGAWYDERFNGLTPIEFTKDTITYIANALPVNQLVVDQVTSFTIKIDSASSLFLQGSTKYHLNITFLNEGTLDASKDIEGNFIFDNIFATADGSSNASGTLSNVIGNIVSNQLEVTGDVTYTSTQQALIDGGSYLISVATNDHTLAIDQSELVNVLMDANDYDRNVDVPDLMGVDSALIYEHPHDKGSGGTTDFIGWVEDGVLYSVDFFLDLSKSAVIQDMDIQLVAFNSATGDHFVIETTTFDFSNVIVSGGVQQINVNTIRGFKLEDTTPSQFDLVKVITGTQVANKQHYLLDLGMKMHWMDWQALAGADAVFYDNTKLKNNLNKLISNYSGLNGYEIHLFINADVQAPNPLGSGTVITKYRFRSPKLTIYPYGGDDTGPTSTRWNTQTQTFDQSANDLLQAVHGSENTNVKIIYTLTSGTITSTTIYTIIRIEEFQQGALLGIWELSSKRLSAANNPLIPLTGQTKTKNTIGATTVISECAIDFTKLNPLSKYKISGRLGSEDSIILSAGKLTESGGVKLTESGGVKIVE